VLGGSPITSFDCAHGTLTLSGAAAGQLSVPINAAASSSQSAFASGLGEQDLQLEDDHGATHSATLTTTIRTTDTQPVELRATP
jgi:hypothetical protein